MRHFASDNNAGAHPDVLAALAAVNAGHESGYGYDSVTERVNAQFRDVFQTETDPYLVFNGTAANVLAMRAMTQSFNAIICGENSHLNTDECGAAENFTGCKLLPVKTPDGKLPVSALGELVKTARDEHNVQPKVIAVSQATEVGTVYSIAELRELADFAHERGMYFYIDGARLANAAASLGVTLAEITRGVGADAAVFGGCKNGILVGEALLFFNADLAENFKYIRKQGMQLASKMRFLSAQFGALLTDELWLRLAQHSNAMASELAARVEAINGVEIAYPVQANSVFARVPAGKVAELQKARRFYVWDERETVVRWMCAFDTELSDVEQFADAIKRVLAGG